MGRFKDIIDAASGAAAEESPAALPAPLPAARKVGRPRGKRSDPSFGPATVWIKKDTHHLVMGLLHEQNKEFSVLVQQLLENWISENSKR